MSIDPKSVVTAEMVAKLAELQGINEDVALDTLSMWERGEGVLDANITDREATAAIFKPVRDAYFANHGVVDAPLSSEEGLAAGDTNNVNELDPTSTSPTAE